MSSTSGLQVASYQHSVFGEEGFYLFIYLVQETLKQHTPVEIEYDGWQIDLF